MKRLIIILLILCPLMNQGKMQAQIYSTACGKYHTYTNSGVLVEPTPFAFRSTSIYGYRTPRRKMYSTAPMQVANGRVKTIASTITGGTLSQNNSNTLTNTGYIPLNNGQDQNTAVISGTPDTPIGGGWDVVLLLGLCCGGYVIYIYRTRKQYITN